MYVFILGCCSSPVWSSSTSLAPNNSQYAHSLITRSKSVSDCFRAAVLWFCENSSLDSYWRGGICKAGICKVRMSDSTFYLSQNPKKSYCLFLKHCRTLHKTEAHGNYVNSLLPSNIFLNYFLQNMILPQRKVPLLFLFLETFKCHLRKIK